MKPMIRRSNPYTSHFSGMFDDFFKDFDAHYAKENSPAVNVKESDEQYHLEIAAPGMKKEDFSIELDNDRLTISSSFTEETHDEKERYTRKEFSYRSFKRSFKLPENEVEKEDISANYEDGILNIMIPKKNMEEVKASKQIAIA